MNNNSFDQVLTAQKEWQEVSADDKAIRKMAVESLKKCSDAILVLSENLKGIGYEWAVLNQLSTDIIVRNISKVENTINVPIPQILTLFWQIVGGISFVDLNTYKHIEFWKEQKLFPPTYYCDGLYVDICCDEWSSSTCADFIDWQDYRTPEEADKFLLALSPDGYHKDNISGGSPYGIYAELTWKPIWENFEWSGIQHPITAPATHLDFLSYLRTTILECAGFPALYGLPGFGLLRERLLKNVPVF